MLPPHTGHWKRYAIILLTALALAVSPADAQSRRKRTRSTTPQRTMESVKKDKTTTERRISETATKLKSNTKELNRQLNRLNSLNADIETTRNQAEELRQHIDSLGSAITMTADSITTLEDELEQMRLAYVKALKELQPYSGATNDIAFIFSAGTFSEAFSRIRYLRQFSAWRERRSERIRDVIDRISDRRSHLTSLRHSQDKAYRKAEETRLSLTKKQEESAQMVKQLRKEDSALKRTLDEQKKKAAALDRELDRLIAAEQARIAREEEEARRREEAARKAKANANKSKTAQQTKQPDKADNRDAASMESSRKTESPSAKEVASSNARTQTAAANSAALSGSFAANKGKLPFPVAGKYKIVRRFGRQPHPTLRHVETENSGIDIEIPAGSSARAVYSGKVSAIFQQDGFNSIVMIRHGHYITIYAGLRTVNVKQGDTVKTGQTLGKIYSDPDDGNRTILHFEIRNEKQKLNPSLWVR
ncbi:MAG: peptidoglycan DD-metalloendopeptidase family protein [Bacteroides sp.]|nr:peptidoglycan DD-metalloendopeptidase family protein [Bacteroides sp.]